METLLPGKQVLNTICQIGWQNIPDKLAYYNRLVYIPSTALTNKYEDIHQMVLTVSLWANQEELDSALKQGEEDFKQYLKTKGIIV